MNKENTFISLDFDGTLHQSIELQKYAKQLVKQGYYIGITTRRSNIFPHNPVFMTDFPSEEVWDLAKKLGIKTINFIHLGYKHDFFNTLFCNVIHIDDDVKEVTWINTNQNKSKYIGQQEECVNICFHIQNIDKFKQKIEQL